MPTHSSPKYVNASTAPPALPKRHKRGPKPATSKKAIEVALDVEQLIYEVTSLLNAASLMNYIYKT